MPAVTKEQNASGRIQNSTKSNDPLALPPNVRPEDYHETVDAIFVAYRGQPEELALHERVAPARSRSTVQHRLVESAKAALKTAESNWVRAYLGGDPEALEKAALERDYAQGRFDALRWRPNGIGRVLDRDNAPEDELRRAMDSRYLIRCAWAYAILQLNPDMSPRVREAFVAVAESAKHYLNRAQFALESLDLGGTSEANDARRRNAHKVIADRDSLMAAVDAAIAEHDSRKAS